MVYSSVIPPLLELEVLVCMDQTVEVRGTEIHHVGCLSQRRRYGFSDLVVSGDPHNPSNVLLTHTPRDSGRVTDYGPF